MDKAKLFEDRVSSSTVDYELEGIGTFKLRSLNRMEALLVGEAGSVPAKEAKILKYGIVEPSLTENEIKRWSQCSKPGEIEAVTKKIAEISGMLEGADKEQFPEDGDDTLS